MYQYNLIPYIKNERNSKFNNKCSKPSDGQIIISDSVAFNIYTYDI